MPNEQTRPSLDILVKSKPTLCGHCGTVVPSDDAEVIRVPDWESLDGSPSPLGVTWIESKHAYNFALRAGNASLVELLLFTESDLWNPCYRYKLDPLRNKSGKVWHCRVPISDSTNAAFYGYLVDGPNQRSQLADHAFDSEKLLLDPYARSVFLPECFDREAARMPGCNIGRAPVGRLDVCRCPFEWGAEPRIRHGSDLVIYEMHVRGFSQHPSSGVAPDARGTFAGVIEKIPYLKELGVTAVELMPVFQFDPDDGNYWGYMPLNFFAPHHHYSTNRSSCEQHSQFREMVRALHEAEIEVILDVVYNHTCEGDHRGPTYSYRGIANSDYYILSPSSDAPYANYSGTGNTLNTANATVRQLIVDSLRYWAKEMHVDGFRFDLASIFSRGSQCEVEFNSPPIFDQIANDPDLANARLIAEPWDAAGLYQLGKQFPDRTWSQWNAHYRDTLQRFVRGDTGMVPDLMTRLYGSSDLFPDDVIHSQRPLQSVNYIASHDGSTLYDLVAYSEKHNLANGHNNTDGPNEFTSNHGMEGELNLEAGLMSFRKQLVKNFFCLLMLSNGTPMFRMGDEFLQTQLGNNNPYNQDNETSWLDWRRLEENREIFRFFKEMIAFRESHSAISRSTFWREDIRWFGAEQPAIDMSNDSRVLAYHLSDARSSGEDLYVMINGSDTARQFLFHTDQSRNWRLAIDTSNEYSFPVDSLDNKCAGSHRVAPRSIVVWCCQS